MTPLLYEHKQAIIMFLSIFVTIITLEQIVGINNHTDEWKYLPQNEISNYNNISNYSIHMISYGNNKWRKAKNRIYKQALDTNWFDTIEVLGPHNLTTEFKQNFTDILKFSKGGGYWIWKFDIILNKLENINHNDILVYLDAGCSINPRGKACFFEYIKMLQQSDYGIISFDMTQLIETRFTTHQIFEAFGINSLLIINKYDEIVNSGQYHATILIMKKSTHLLNILLNCFDILHSDPKLITDYYNNMGQIDSFKDNRHDQSILSVARKIHGSVTIKDECCCRRCWNDTDALTVPFWATRANRYQTRLK